MYDDVRWTGGSHMGGGGGGGGGGGQSLIVINHKLCIDHVTVG